MKNHPEHLKTFYALLQRARLKITPARVRILEVLHHAHAPLSIQQISAELETGEVDIVTIYRTISALQKINAVKQTHLNAKERAYELAGEHHHHLVCTSCNAVEDITLNDQFEQYQKIITKKSGFKIMDHSLEFFGLCAPCQKN